MKKHYQIGIEVSTDELYFTVVSRQRQQWLIQETDSISFQLGRLDHALHILRQQISRSIRHTIIGLPYHQVIIKEIQVDSNLTAEEIYQYLQHRATTIFGDAAGPLYLDFEKISLDSTEQITIRVVAAPKTQVNEWKLRCQKNGFKLMAVDIDVLSLLRLTPWLQEHNHQRAQAFIWLKKTELILIVMNSDQLIYVKRSSLSTSLSICEQLTMMFQFFYGLYPQCDLEQGLVFGEVQALDFNNLILLGQNYLAIKLAVFKDHFISSSSQFCSLALSVYPYAY